jgi:hypothetical protein
MTTALTTTAAIWAEYEKDVMVFRKRCRERHKAMAKLEEAMADKTMVGTAVFRSRYEADVYYRQYSLTHSEVNTKLKDGEIHICARPDGIGEFDVDGRWHMKFKAHEIQAAQLEMADTGNAMRKAELRCRELCRAHNVARRMETVKEPEKVSFTSKTGLEQLVREWFLKPWPDTLDKWYRSRGRRRPRYTDDDRAACEDEEGNNRVVVFTGEDEVQHRVAFLHKIGDPTDIYRGFKSLGTEVYYISDEVEAMYSMRELCERIVVGKKQAGAT